MTERRQPRVLCVGLVTLDVVQTVDRLPTSNVKQQALGLSVDFGGPAANAAGVVAGLGGDVRLLTALGASPAAGAVRGYLKQAGVETLDLARPGVQQAFAVSTVLVEQATGDRAVVSTNAGDERVTTVGEESAPEGAEAETDEDLIDQVTWADVVLVDGHHMSLGLAVVRAARAVGTPVVFDGGSWKPRTQELLRLVDVAVVSDDFAAPSGTVTDLMRSAGVPAFGQSRGHLPWTLEVGTEQHVINVQAVPPAEMVDTLGAGDVLHGALAYSLASARLQVGAETRGLEGVDIVAAARFASEKASLSCRSAGARGWLDQSRGRRYRGSRPPRPVG
ncbi:MAG: PfkB family carbohydrate kinase [Propionibacteriaceae bacterium]|nr:PfkB family carbohydrate kinase [Propionibacteriaceae bacterium]